MKKRNFKKGKKAVSNPAPRAFKAQNSVPMSHEEIFLMLMLSRAVMKFGSFTHQAFCDYCQGCHDAILAASTTFTSPVVSMSTFQTNITAFRNAIAAYGPPGNRGSKAQHTAMITARKKLEGNQRALTAYVNSIANGDLPTVLLSGMMPNETRNPFGVLPAPQNLHSPFSKHTIQGQYRLRWKKVRGADSYNLYTSPDGDWNNRVLVLDVNKTLAVYSDPSIPSGTLRSFWVTAVGAAGEGVASDVCECRNF